MYARGRNKAKAAERALEMVPSRALDLTRGLLLAGFLLALLLRIGAGAG